MITTTIRISWETWDRLRKISNKKSFDEIINDILDNYNNKFIQPEPEIGTPTNKEPNYAFVKENKKELPQSVIDEIKKSYKDLGYVTNIDEEIQKAIQRAKDKLK